LSKRVTLTKNNQRGLAKIVGGCWVSTIGKEQLDDAVPAALRGHMQRCGALNGPARWGTLLQERTAALKVAAPRRHKQQQRCVLCHTLASLKFR
tara:strand:- start:57 stop:338 length:282 start_codon:yes stop_codon:yes gene_type:complete